MIGYKAGLTFIMNDMQDKISIVTAFFDIGRGNLPHQKNGKDLPSYMHRSNDKYFEYFNNLAKIKNDMVVYTTSDFAEKILKIRESHGNLNNTNIVILDSYDIEDVSSIKIKMSEIMLSQDFISKVSNPSNLEYWNVDYNLIMLLKPSYVADAISKGYVKNNQVAWIDFGYCRDQNTIPFTDEWTYPFDYNKINMFNMKNVDQAGSIESIVYSGDVYIQGCHIVSGKKGWEWLKNSVFESMHYLMNVGLVDDDQTLFFISYLKNKDKFVLRHNSPDDWFRIFKDYNKKGDI